MCQCQQAGFDPYANRDPTMCPYCGAGAGVYAVPYPSLTVSYDPYWASRVTPTNRPMTTLVPTKRFRGEIRVGNCLYIYE